MNINSAIKAFAQSNPANIFRDSLGQKPLNIDLEARHLQQIAGIARQLEGGTSKAR